MQQHPTYDHLKTAAPDPYTTNNGGTADVVGITCWSSSSDAHIKVEQIVGVSDGQYQHNPFPINSSSSIDAVPGVGSVYSTENGYPLPAQLQSIAMESVSVKTETVPAAAVLEAVGQQS